MRIGPLDHLRVSSVAGVALLAGAFALAGCGDHDNPINGGGRGGPDPIFSADDFDEAESCRDCHPDQYDEWSGSMHAYAITDPVWEAVRAAGQSAYTNALDGACSPCHSAIGNRSGEIPWGPLDRESMSAPTREGVGCDLCHTITSITKLSNGGFVLTPGDVKYGSTQNPVPNPVHDSEFSPLYQESEYCGSCHDFVTGGGFELETTYREWKGGFRDEWRTGGFATTGKTCQGCHMPTYIGRATPDSPERELHRHQMVGADLALIDFPNRPEQLQLVTEMLRNALTMDVVSPQSIQRGNALSLDVNLTNDKTGHDVPSGVPFNRQMWLSIVVRNDANKVIYSTGQLDANDDLMDDNSAFPERDPDLFNAQATMLRADSTPTGATWEAAFLTNPSIRPGETRTIEYTVPTTDETAGDLTVEIVLRFRSFPPHVFRGLGLDHLLPIPIIDMAEQTLVVSIE